jgi:tetratricopeptide (TPR) repeat protein
MNKTPFYLVLITLLLAACTSKDQQFNQTQALYKQALENKDASTVKLALNQLLLIDSTNVEYQDSLSRVYMRNGNFEAGLKYAELVYNKGKAKSKLKENMALAYQQIGETEKAEKFIDNLIVETRQYKYVYQKLVIQYENGNQPMFDSLSTQILEQVETDSLMAANNVPMPGPVSGVQHLVPIKAATLFLIGNNELERKQNVNTAVEYLKRSIDEYDQFEMPRYVLMELEKMMYGGGR